mmetsp:Transcript_7375/g.20482  ORF Transcript_7375/g.20482 Transcript_7375/m.20482 type:complete len:82 (+) Transcript_7375:1727-1972(+)
MGLGGRRSQFKKLVCTVQERSSVRLWKRNEFLEKSFMLARLTRREYCLRLEEAKDMLVLWYREGERSLGRDDPPASIEQSI